MAQLPYVVIVTSSDCRACLALHSSGSFSRTGPINPEVDILGFKWDANSFWKLLLGSNTPTLDMPPRFRVLEYELAKMSDISPEGVKSFTVFSLSSNEDGSFIRRDTFVRAGKNGNDTIKLIDDGENPIRLKDPFTDLVKSTFPPLANYIAQFPSLLFFSSSEWRKALATKDRSYAPYGKAFSLVTGAKPDGSGWGVVSRDQSKDNWTKTFIAYAEYVANNEDFLLPPKNEVPVENKNSAAASKARKSPVPAVLSPSSKNSPLKCGSPLVKIISLAARPPYIPVRR